MRILSVINDNKLNPDKKRTGQYTAVVMANRKKEPITLFYSSILYAGENMQALLAGRPEGLGSFITMCDALGANTLSYKDLIESNCLAHALVKFIDLESMSPYDLSRPIDNLTKVFENDNKTQGMCDHDRLKYHKKHSKPILDKLKTWIQDQLDLNIVEPGGHFGKVLKYCLKHWHKLTRFLTAAGCPVSNNQAERMLKIIIRLRKSSMFHKTEHGAEVCATLLSLIQTAIDHDLNPADYLTHLLQNADLIIKESSRGLTTGTRLFYNTGFRVKHGMTGEEHHPARQSLGKPAFVGDPCCKQIISSVAFIATVSVCALGQHLSFPLEKRLWHSQKSLPS